MFETPLGFDREVNQGVVDLGVRRRGTSPSAGPSPTGGRSAEVEDQGVAAVVQKTGDRGA
ncbi:hypothetical protein [Streptomyces sp. NPDC059979]|uniref:hypothetical protein n=1 Tax=unclassified Streptomyces TaxID=2593676 RepID=UPI00364C238A